MRDALQQARGFFQQGASILGVYLRGIYNRFSSDTVFIWAGAIAFKVLVTIVPITVLAAGVLGLVLRQQTPFGTVTTYLQSFLPNYQAEQAVEIIRALAEAGQTNAIIGGLGLIFSAITLFSTLRVVVAGVFKRQSQSRSVVHAKLFDLRMATQVGLLFLLSVGITFAFRTITPMGLDLLRWLSLDWLWIEEGWRQTLQGMAWVFPFVITTVMFFQLYYFVPIPRPSVRSALIGSVSAGILWELLKNGFTLAASRIGYIDRFSGTVGQVGLAFGLALAMILWVFYSGVVLVIGAEVAAIHEERQIESPRTPHQQAETIPPSRLSNQSPPVQRPEGDQQDHFPS